MLSAKFINNHHTRRTALLVALLSLAAACGSNDTATSSNCPNDAPQSCPATIPSYSNEVAPIIQQACLSCHGPGGVEGNVFPLQDYNDVFIKRQAMLTQVSSCRMPQAGGGVTLDANDRVTLLTWLVCNAPNN